MPAQHTWDWQQSSRLSIRTLECRQLQLAWPLSVAEVLHHAASIAVTVGIVALPTIS